MEKITIKPLNSQDWQKYKQIRLEALKTNPTAFLNTFEDVSGYPDDKWQEQLKKSAKKDGVFYLFAFDNEKIIGMNGMYWDNKPVIKHIAEVFGVFVNPGYRGKGIGKRLMNEMIFEISNNPQFTKIKIGVNAENEPAYNLYISTGFKAIGRHEKELKFGDKYYDEILLELLI